MLGESVEELFAVFFGDLKMIGGNGVGADGLAVVAGVEEAGLHFDQVDDAAERPRAIRFAARSDGNDDRHRPPLAGRVGRQPLVNAFERLGEIGPDHVHLVDEHQPRHAVLVRLPPHRFRLRLDAFLGVEDDHRAVEHAEAPFHLGREIDVARRVDQVDGAVGPVERDARGVDGDAAFLLLGVVVGFGGPFVHAAELVLGPGVVEQVLGGRGLARHRCGR